MSQADLFVALSTTPQARSANLLMNVSKIMFPKLNLRDTQDFIKNIRDLGPIPEGVIVCTLDVSSLYTIIPNHEGILAMADKLRSDPTKTPITKFIFDLLKLVLHSMNFEFNGEYYLHIGGTAVGTSLAQSQH